MSESEENVLIDMLNSESDDDIDFACSIVNQMKSNRELINKLIPDHWTDEECKWRKSLLYERAQYFRKDMKGMKFLKLIRDDV